MGKNANKFLIGCCVVVAALGVPSAAFAAVEITEIMYDLSGGDSGREWIEVTNMGTGPVDITGYKFFEANTNHALTLLSGSGVLQPQGSAVIVQDQAKFMSDSPSFSGTLLKASFDLSNSGESIALKPTSSSAPDDSVSYDAGMGANGDGNSLHRQAGSTLFFAASPDPGVFVVSSGTTGVTEETGSVETAATAQQNSSSLPPSITAEVDVPIETMVGGGAFFSANAYGSIGMPLSGARFVWNFGDGATAEGQRVFHAYSYPGTYLVSVTAASGISSALATARTTAVPAQVGLIAEGDGSLTIANRSKSNLDVGFWQLACGSSSFIIPEHTTILAGKGVRFSSSIMHVFGDTSARLLYPNGALAAVASPGMHSPLRGETVDLPSASGTRAPVPATAAKTPDVPLAAESDPPALSAAAAKSSTSLPLWGTFLGLGALITLGVAGTWYARPLPETKKKDEETLPSADEFTIK